MCIVHPGTYRRKNADGKKSIKGFLHRTMQLHEHPSVTEFETKGVKR